MSILTSTRDEMSFCPGCSHTAMLERLAAAVDRLGRRPEQVCLVSDIGCIGQADRYFGTHTFHGLHGRALTYAEGIQRARPDLLVVVLIGDGGAGIGTAHLVHAARRGVGIKVMVCNNFVFGMTGGQHSVTTPVAGLTVTTPGGAVDHPFDMCATVGVNGAAYVARHSIFDPAIVDHLEAALRAPGFALVDIWELCVAYYTVDNKLTPPALKAQAERLGMPFGVLYQRPPAAAASGAATPPAAAPQAGTAPPPATVARPKSAAASGAAPPLAWRGHRTEISVAGSAGQRVRSAVGVLGEIAVAGGLFAAQQDDFPISVRRGHSISNLIVAAEPIRYGGVDDPDLVVLLSEDGLRRVGRLDHLRAESTVLAEAGLSLPHTAARVLRYERAAFEKLAGKNSMALAVLVYGALCCGWVTGAALLEGARHSLTGRYRDESLRAIEAGLALFAAAENR